MKSVAKNVNFYEKVNMFSCPVCPSDKEQNMILFGVLTVVAIVGVIVLVFIVPVTKKVSA